MVFTLQKLAYIACSETMRNFYNENLPGGMKVDVQQCCIENLRYCRKRFASRPKNRKTCWIAARYGHLDCLDMALSFGAKLTAGTAKKACQYGHLECLKYAMDNGVEIYKDTGLWALAHDQMECFQYLVANGWDYYKRSKTCLETAAQGESLRLVKLLHALGSPWSVEVTYIAAAKGHYEMLKYAFENGCEMHHLAAIAASFKKNFWCAKYAANNGASFRQHPETYAWITQKEAEMAKAEREAENQMAGIEKEVKEVEEVVEEEMEEEGPKAFCEVVPITDITE